MNNSYKRIMLILHNAQSGINHCYIEHKGHRYFEDPNDLDEVIAYIDELHEQLQQNGDNCKAHPYD